MPLLLDVDEDGQHQEAHAADDAPEGPVRDDENENTEEAAAIS